MFVFLTLNALLLASAHNCIHDKLMSHDSRDDASRELVKRDVKAVTLGPYAPLRIKIDESFLSKSDGCVLLCKSVHVCVTCTCVCVL